MDFLTSFQALSYILAALLFILALAGLSQQRTAVRGNYFGIIGMAFALIATICVGLNVSGIDPAITFVLMLVAILGGAVYGVWKARTVHMTEMPQLVAMLHSFVGASAVLVGYNSYLSPSAAYAGTEFGFHIGEVGLAVFIGAVTLTGSIVAYLKLAGRISGRPLTLPGRNTINLCVIIACLVLIGLMIGIDSSVAGLVFLSIITLLSLFLGWHFVMAIGGGDMPVVVSMLNSLSGWAAAMAGFTLGNDLLIITGALVGSSGAYLSNIMCKGMNRTFVSVILGGFGGGGKPAASAGSGSAAQEMGDYTEITPQECAELLKSAKSVVITPGYGMAVAQAQFPVADLTKKLRDLGVDVKFAVHPVAGRMPGHMNVLLAEAKVPYDIVLEMDEINDDLDKVDVVLVIGANDTVNPSAETDPTSPIAGMPVLRVWNASRVVVFKRSMGNAGYSGVQNPLFFNENTDMLLGDAKASVDAINAAL